MNIFLRNKRFRKIAVANFLSVIGDKMYYLAMLAYVSTLPQAQVAIGLVSVSELIPQMFASLTGYKADQTMKRGKNLILADIVRSFIYLLVGFLFVSNLTGWIIIIFIVLLNFTSDIIGTYASGLRLPLIVSVTGKEEYTEASGFTQGVSQVIGMISQFISASLIVVITYSQLAVVNAGTFLISGLIMLSFFRTSPKLAIKETTLPNEVSTNSNYFSNLKESILMLKNEARLFNVIMTIITLNAMLSSMVPIIQMIIVANQEMLISSYGLTIAILNTIISVSLALGSIIGVKLLKQISLEQLVFYCLICTTIFYPVLLLNNLVATLIVLHPICFLVGTMIPKLSGWIVHIVEEEKLALTIGILNTLLAGLAPLATFIIIIVAAAVSPKASIVLLFIMSVFLIIFNLRKKENVQKIERIKK